MANTVEIALRLLKNEFEKDSKAAASAFAADLKKIEKASDQLTAAQKRASRDADRLQAARSNLGVTSLRDQQREVAKLTGSYNRLASSGKLSTRELTQAQEALRRKVAEVRGEVVREGNAITAIGKQLAPFIGLAAGGLFAKNLARSAISAADDYKRLNSQLRLVTDSEQELADTNKKLFELAQQTRSEFAPVVTLYARAARATENLNLSQNTLLTITRAVNQAMQISGASSQEASSSILQFTQALQSGVLRGEEFNSISENGARLLTALADGIGVPIEQMRTLAESGELTRDRLIAALTDQASVIDAEFQKLETTVDGALTGLRNSFQRAAATTDTKPLVDSIKALTALLQDPAIIAGLSSLTGFLVDIVNLSLKAAAGLGNLGKEIANNLKLTFDDSVDDIEALTIQINQLKADLSQGFDIAFSGGFPTLTLVDEDQTKKQIAILEALRDAKQKAAGGATADETQSQQQAIARERETADQIIGVNRQIAEVKKNLAELGKERAKLIADEQIKIAKDQGGELIRLIKQDFNEQQKAINDRLQLVKEAGQKIIDIEREIADERRNIQDINRGVQEKLFERSLTGKSDVEQQAEIEKRAAEKLIEARQLLAQGKLEEANQQAQEVQSLSDRLSNIDRANALLVAGADIEKQVSEQNIKNRQASAAALQKYQELQQRVVNLQREELEAQQASVDALAERLNALGRESPTIEIDSNIAELIKQVDQLEQRLRNLSGAGFRVGGQIPGFAAGGQIGRRLIMAEDGEWYLPPSVVNHYGASRIAAINSMQLPGFAEGGKLPGYGGGDRRLMAPKIGGFIIRKEAARLYGDGLMSALLAKKLPKFADGGQIRINQGLLSLPGMAAGGAIAAATAGDGPVQRHEIVINKQPFDVFGERDQIRGLVNAIAEVARGG